MHDLLLEDPIIIFMDLDNPLLVDEILIIYYEIQIIQQYLDDNITK